jgi:hypothetical protein
MHNTIRQIAVILATSAAVAVGTMVPFADAAAPAPATNSAPLALSCDRNCLYAVLDQYLAALARRDIARVPWAPVVRNTENNVTLPVGDGLWGTLTKLGSYQLKIADPDTGEVGYFGAVDENGAVSPFALRLKVVQKQVVEVETLVRRKADEANYMADPEFIDKPIFNEVIPAASRLPRERLISIADGYFDTLQLNDGTLFTQFDEKCDRTENGFRTTNNPDGVRFSPIMALGCEAQFKTGSFRYDDRLRGRRFPLVDVERGLVLAGGFIDHAGRLGEYTLANGEKATSRYRRPHSYYLLELFKITPQGRIRQVEAVFMTVPYRMPSPWMPED